jgi:hypothetical protein
MDKSKNKFFKVPKKKGVVPTGYVPEGINQKFLFAVNDYLLIIMEETKRQNYINKYSSITEPLAYLSPLYFASAIAFLDKHNNGPNEKNFNDTAVTDYVSRLFSVSNKVVGPSTLKLRRKIEFLRYIRLLISINQNLAQL